MRWVKKIHYLYAFGINGQFIKFGVSSDPLVRLLNVQGSSPYPVDLLSVSAEIENRKDAFAVETLIHTCLVKFHTRLEWFKSCPKTMAFASLMNGQKVDKIRGIAASWCMSDIDMEASPEGRLRLVSALTASKREM